MIVHSPKANAQLMEKHFMFVIKRTISKFAAHMLVKKLHEIEKDISNEPSYQSVKFFY